MYYQEGFADEEALDSAIIQLVGEVDVLSQDVERIQESWQESFSSPPLVNPSANQASGRYGDFIWEALTTTVDQDDILPFLEDIFEESRSQSEDISGEDISEQDVGRVDRDDVIPILEEAAGVSRARSDENPPQVLERAEPTDQGNEARLGLQPEEGASSTNDGVSLGEFDHCVDRAIQRLRNRLLNVIGTGDWHHTPNPISSEVENETRPESEGAASSINTDSTPPTSELPSEPLCWVNNLRGERASKGIRQKGIAEWNENPQSEGAGSVNAMRVNELDGCPEAPLRLSDEDVARNRGIEHGQRKAKSRQTPMNDGTHDDVDHNTAGLRIERPEPPSPSAFVEAPWSIFIPRTPHQPRSGLRRSNSTPQLQEMSENSSLKEESLPKIVTRRQSVNQIRPWLESNASALIGTSNTAQANLPNLTQHAIPDKLVHMQALFNEQIDSVCEAIREIREFALRRNSVANKQLVDALRCLTQAKSEIRKDAFKLWEDVDFENVTPESNQRAQERLRNNAIVTGVPMVANENVLEIVKRIGYYLGRPIDDMYIEDAYRLNKTDPSSPIIVKFTYLALKDILINASSKSELYANELGIRVGERSLVSIQDQLTPFNINLLEKAKVLMDNGCISLWVEKGTVWFKKRGSTACKLDSIAKLLVLLREFKFHTDNN